jgi:cyclohexa-1,5-dienecarbonyl-CoA hydratase
MAEANGAVRREASDGVATITLDRPPLNILDMATMRELARAFEESRDDRVVLLRAEGKVFSAGADVGEHLGEVAPEMIRTFHDLFRAIWSVRGITVAAVHGAALGGGCELAVGCDVVFASEAASFGQPESLVGVFPPVAAVLWPRLAGERRAVELLASGDKMSAQEAFEVGLVNRVFPADGFEESVKKALTPFKTKSLVVIDHIKRAIRAARGEDLLEALDRVERIYLDSLMRTHDAEEGLRAFLEKRQPRWEDR